MEKEIVKRSVVEQVVLDLGGTVINLEKTGKKVLLRVEHGFEQDKTGESKPIIPIIN